MVYKLVIKDNKNSPIKYLHALDNFQNCREYVFKSGVNIIEMTEGYVDKVKKLVNNLVR